MNDKLPILALVSMTLIFPFDNIRRLKFVYDYRNDLYFFKMKQTSGDSIKVFIRVRPLNEKEKDTQSCVSFSPNAIEMKDK